MWTLRFTPGWTHFHSRASGVRYSVSSPNLIGLHVLAVEGATAQMCQSRAQAVSLIELTDAKLQRLCQNPPRAFSATRARMRTHRA